MRAAGASLRPALSLHARPVRVADLPAGWGISYGPTFRTAGPARIATLPVGYGDGWSRALSNRAEAIVRGLRVPLVGNVAMDAVMADVSDVPGAPVTVADEFVLIGPPGSAGDHRRGGRPRPRDELLGGRDRLRPAPASGVPCRVRAGCGPNADFARVRMTRLEIWNGDICVLEVDAIVNPAAPSLWMSAGVGGALKRAGGDAIEFAAVRQGPVPVGSAVVTAGGTLAARYVIHAVSLDHDHRTSAAAIGTRSAAR